MEVKKRCGPKIIYITIPGDLRISTVEYLMRKYNISSLPAVLVNESSIYYSPLSVDEFTEILGC